MSTFHTPVATSSAPRAPVNTPGIPRLTFIVDAVDDVLDRLRPHGAELVGEVAQYEDISARTSSCSRTRLPSAEC
jgi:hypothetical protein